MSGEDEDRVYLRYILQQNTAEIQKLSHLIEEVRNNQLSSIAVGQAVEYVAAKVDQVIERQNRQGRLLKTIQAEVAKDPRNTIRPPAGDDSGIHMLGPEMMAALQTARETHASHGRRDSWFYRKKWSLVFTGLSIIVAAVLGACVHAVAPTLLHGAMAKESVR